jgi:imidazole glycerol phosphate synthase glutamine amidotransferase subunit
VTSVVILDYGSGNVRSAQRAVETTGAKVSISADFDEALEADALLVPGVGAFSACVQGIKNVRGEQIIGRRLAGGRPVLGICVGMQVLFERSTEHSGDSFFEGLNEWPGTVDKLTHQFFPTWVGITWLPQPDHKCLMELRMSASILFILMPRESGNWIHMKCWLLPKLVGLTTVMILLLRLKMVRFGLPSFIPKNLAKPV